MSEITQRIVLRMRALGLEEIDVAAAVRVAQSTVNRWTHHLSDPRSQYVPPLAAKLGVSTAWLLTGEEQQLDEQVALAAYAAIVPFERIAGQLLQKSRLTKAEQAELRDALQGAATFRALLGLKPSEGEA